MTTTSAAVVTLLAGLTAFVLGKDFTVAGFSKTLVVVAVVLLGAATLLATISGLLRRYEVPSAGTLQAMLGTHWVDSEVSARLAVGWMDLDTLLSMRSANNRKSWWLDLSLWLQLAGLLALALAVAWQTSAAL